MALKSIGVDNHTALSDVTASNYPLVLLLASYWTGTWPSVVTLGELVHLGSCT